MEKSLKFNVAKVGYPISWSVAMGLVLVLGNLPAVANDDTPFVPIAIAQATPATPIRRPTLSLGSEGEAVSELQAVLKLLGYYQGAVSGFYDESTASAVSRFQQAAGIAADGVAGPTTWSRLFPSPTSASTPPPVPVNREATAVLPPPIPSGNAASGFPTPEALRTNSGNGNRQPPQTTTPAPQTTTVAFPVLRAGMQGPAVTKLQERLQALGFLQGAVDGVFGPATQAAVIAAQQEFQLEPDGVVGPATWTALLR